MCCNISEPPNIDIDATHAWQFCIHYKSSCIAYAHCLKRLPVIHLSGILLMPEVDNRHTSICSVDGWGDRNTKYKFAPV